MTQLRSRGFARRTVTSRDRVRLSAAVVASFIPGPYSRMVAIDCRPTCDGAWLGRVPIREGHELDARKVIACVSDDASRLLRGALLAVPAVPPAESNDRVLSPIRPLPVGTFYFDAAATRASFDIGWASAEAFVTREREWLAR